MAGESVVSLRDRLLHELTELERIVRLEDEDATLYQKRNAGFDFQNETTQLLLSVCEKLAKAKSVMDQANFEEHTSELPYLISHYCTSIATGLSESAHREKLAATFGGARNRLPPRPKLWTTLCCNREFPPRQTWWIDTMAQLAFEPQVLRGGKIVTSSPLDVVPGDVIFIAAGQKAVADCRVLVHADQSMVDVAHVTKIPKDLRMVSTRNTAIAAIDSANIILKDSYMVSGGAFCTVVRSPSDPFVPPSVYSGNVMTNNTVGFEIDTKLPAGMSLASAKTVFKALCTKAQLAPRSFSTIAQLAKIGTLVLPLSTDVLGKGTVPNFCATASRLGKTVVLVNCNCARDAIESLCKDLGADCCEFDDLSDASELPLDSACENLPPGQARTDTKFDHCGSPCHSVFFSGQFSQPWCVPEAALGEEAKRISDLVNDLRAKKGPIVLHGISQAGLVSLCRKLTSESRPLLYGMNEFHYQRCFRELVFGYDLMCINASRLEHAFGAGGRPADLGKIQETSEVPTATTAVSHQRTDQRDSNSSASSRNEANDMFTVDHAAMKQRCTESSVDVGVKQGIGVFLSVNSIGVVSEYADCVLLRSDLGCLGQALEIVTKA